MSRVIINPFTSEEVDYDKRSLLSLYKEKERRLGKKNLHYLCKNILGYEDLTDENGFHGDYCRHLQSEESRFKLELTPRGTLKSTIGTIGLSISEIINDPNIRILIDSQNFTNSTKFLSEIVGHFRKNEKFIDLYGNYLDKGFTGGAKEITVSKRTNWRKEPTITCTGVEVSRTGMHYDIILADDLHDEKNTDNSDQIEKVIRHYKLLLSLLDPPKNRIGMRPSRLFIHGTIWHFADLYNWLMAKDRERQQMGRKSKFKIFKRDSFKGTVEDLMAGKIKKKHLLWPERLTTEYLADQYIEQGPYIFSCQYRLNPIDDENATFKRSWIKIVHPKDLSERLNVYTTVDPMQDEEGTDFLAAVTVAVDEKWNINIIDCVRMKADEHETVEQLNEIYKKWKPKKIGIEGTAWQKSYVRYVKLLQMQKGYKLPIVTLDKDTTKSKPFRIKGMVPYWKAGLFRIVTDKTDLSDITGPMASLIDELTRYPKTKNDDTIDALAYMNQLTHCPSILSILKPKPHYRSLFAIRERMKVKKNKKLGSRNVRNALNVA